MSLRGLRTLALLASCTGLACAGEPAPPPPNVLFVLVDTLRADALGAYTPGALTPHMDALARDGVLFERVVAPSSWTKTSMASIVTSRDPSGHGVRGVDDVLPDSLDTLAEAFEDAGYQTIGVNANPWLKRDSGFEAGFASYSFVTWDAESVHDALRQALDDADPERPVFLYLHYMDTHAPYDPGPWFSGPPVEVPGLGALADEDLEVGYRGGHIDGVAVRERVRALYDASVRDLDAKLMGLWAELRERGFLRDAVVVLTSDHGEAFGEHGTTAHGRDFYPEVYAVPLIFVAPGRIPAGVRVPAQVASIDVAPTLLALASLPVPEGFEGQPLLPMDGGLESRVAIGAIGGNDRAPDVDIVGVVYDDLLYLRERRGDRVELYDLRTDPAAWNDLGRDHPEAARLAAREPTREPPRAETRSVDAETRAELEALGYAPPDPSPAPAAGASPAP